jgi:hypothetical protein
MRAPLVLRSTVFSCAALTAVVFALYGPSFRYSFQLYDDNAYVTDNSFVRGGLTATSVAWAFRDDGPERRIEWHPLTMISHMLDVQLWGMRSGFHHLTNVFFHALNTCLLFLFLKRETEESGKAWLTAALFALHPINVESVAWIAERKNLLSMCFWLLTLISYGSYLRRPTRLRYSVAFGWYVLGWLSKPIMAVLPMILMLLDFWPWKRWTAGQEQGETLRELAAEKWPFFALAIPLGAWACFVQQHVGTLKQGVPFSWSSQWTPALVAFALSPFKMLWPTRLTFFYPLTGLTLPLTQWGPSLLLVVAVSWLALRIRRSAPYFFVGWAWYIITYLPASGLLMQIGLYSHEDHLLYLPMVGLLICLVWSISKFMTLARAPSGFRTATSAAVLVIVVLLSRRQLNYWDDSVSLLRHEWDVIGNPSLNPRARNNLCGLYMFHADHWAEEQRLIEAAEGYQHALWLEPGNVYLALKLTGLEVRLGQVEQAQRTVATTLQWHPDNARLLKAQDYLRAHYRGQHRSRTTEARPNAVN